MRLIVEQLEARLLLAAPIKPFDLDLPAAGDSGSSDSDDITNLNNGTIELIAETDSTVAVYNAGYLGDAVGQNDIYFYEAGSSVVIEAEKGAVAGAMQTNNAQGGFQGTGYIEDTAASSGSPEDGGAASYTFYVSTEDDYYVHARLYFPNGSQNSFFINIDGQWDIGENGPALWSNTFNSWHFETATTQVNQAGDQTWHLTVGWHTLEVHGREAWSKLDRFVIGNNAAAPVDPGGAESVTYETYQYTFGAGDLIGSAYGTANNIRTTAQNLDGTSDFSDPLAITYDNAAVTPGTTELTAVSDSGDSNTDNLTNDTTATFSGGAGSVEPNATVYLRVETVDKRNATANADGSYSITLQAGDLAQGANAVDIYYVDAAGNSSSGSADLTVTLDTQADAPAGAPDLAAGSDTGLDNSDDYTNDATPTFTGAAGAVEDSATVWLRVGGVNKQSAAAGGDGSYSITLGAGILAEGANVVDIIYIDAAGNTSGDSPNLTVTLDTVSDKPAAPDLTGNAAHDTGVSQVDNITNNDNCQITGTAIANGTIHIRVNGVEVDTAASDGGGNWSYDFIDGDLTEGANNINVTAEDSLGNPESAYSDSLIITLDTILATPAAPDLRAASDTGSSNTDNITGDDAAWFDGFAEPSATVQLLVAAAGKGTDTADAATGAWSIQLSNGDLAVGANDVTVTATDAAGNTATSSILVVTYDGGASIPNAPLLSASSDSGSSDADGITNIAAATIYGSVAGGNPVEAGATVQVRTNKNGGGWVEVGNTVADGNGNWSYTLDGVDDLAEGANLVDIYITDLAGDDSGDSDDLSITLDITANAPAAAPDLDSAGDTGDSDIDNITSETAGSFSGPNGSVEADSTVWLRIDGSNIRSAAADGNGAYSVTLLGGDMTEGAHLVDIIYIDAAGNFSGDSPDLAATLDTLTAAPAAPDLDGASDTGSSNSDNLTNDATATFIGSANSVEGNSTVNLRVGGLEKRSVVANADGSYSITLQIGDLTEGANQVDVYYRDPAGNVSANGPDLTVTLDTAIADPALPDLADSSDTGSDNSDDITAETRPTIRGAAGAVEGLSTVRIWLDTPGGPEQEAGATAAAVDGSWSYTFTSANPLEEGDNIIHIAAVDPAGNVSNNSANLTVTVDFGTGAQSAPALDAASDTGNSNDDNITADNTPTINGACPAGAVIKLRTNAVIMATFTDNDANDGNAAAGIWSYSFNGGDMNEGVNTIAFLTIDTQNNTSDWSQNLVVTLDTNIQQPTKPNLTTADDSGSDSGDDITNETAPTISGTAEVNSTVTVDVNGGAFTDTAATAANGSWSFTLTDGWLNEGSNTIFVSATDVAGNVSAASENLIITLDTTINAPSQPDLTGATDTGGSNSDNITRHANPRIVGTADPDTRIAVRLDPEGAATVVGITWADGLGNWSYTFAGDDLAEGANDIDVMSTDIAGNSADSANLTITIETAINAPAAPDLQAASDLGDADDDDLTSLAASTITGAADPNCTIYVRVNGTEVGGGASDGLGDWSYTFDGGDDLVEGINIIDAYAEDAVGNISDYSNDLVITLDTTVATPAQADLETAADSGLSDGDNYTNIANATISGACEAGATITISLNGNDSYDTTADQDDGTVDGLWSYTFAGGLNGSVGGTANIIKAAQRDRAGNSSAFGPTLTITLDNAAETPTTPDLLAVSDSGDADDDNLTNIRNITITGTVETNSSLQLFIDQGAGPALADTISEHLISTGAWNYTFASGQLAEGANQITVVAIDKADNISAASTPLVISLDTAISQPGLPDLTADSDTGDFDNDEITSDETPAFLGWADPNTHITIRVDGEPINTVDADISGDWTYTFAQGEIQTGVHRIDVVATDAAGNVSVPSDDLTIWLNVEPTQPAGPNLLAASDSGSISTDNLTNITTPVIAGKADANCTVFVYVDAELTGSSATDENGFWQFGFSQGDLSESDNEVTIITEDSSGLRSSASYPLTITLDTTGPTAPLPDLQPGSDTGVSNSDNLTSDETATIEGVTEPSALVDLYLNDEYLTQLTATVFGNWSYTFAPGILTAGENDIYLTITDRVGNLSPASDVLTIILDAQQDAPEAPVLSPETDTGASDTDGLTNNPHSEITGMVKPRSSVEVRISGVSTATVAADTEGNWQYAFEAGQLKEGLNYVEIISTDPVGNAARSEVLELTLDTIAPVLYNYAPKGVYTHTTHIIELYINGNDLEAAAAYDTAGYVLTGAGGDGGFDDGNEWIIPLSGVALNAVAGLVRINTVITLTDDVYQFIIDPVVSLRDEAGNAAQLSLSPQQGEPYTEQTEPLILEFTIDTEGPPAPAAPQLDPDSDSGSSDSDNITNEADPLIHIAADPEITVELICNGRSAGFAYETTPGEYYLIIENSLLREGENLLLARAFDALGNSSDLSDSQTFIYDRQGPEVAAIVVDSLWFNFGPAQITAVFAETDIDPATITYLDTYVLLGSGGDGTFDDGNEIPIIPTAVDYFSATRSVILTLPQTVAGYSQLGPDAYQLTVSAAGAITDLAGNAMIESASQAFAVVGAETIHSNQRRRFTTADQTTFTVAVEGQGDAVVLLGEAVGSENTIEKIMVSNTNENTRLWIQAPGNEGRVTVGQILIDSPLKAIRAGRIDLTRQIDASQSVSLLKVGAVYDNAVLNLTSDTEEAEIESGEGLRIYAGDVGQNVQLNVSGHLRALKAARYQGGAVAADSIYSIRITQGDMAAEVNVSSGDLGWIKVHRGDLTGNLDIGGQIGKVKVLQGQLTADIRAQENIDVVLARRGLSATISAGNNIGKVKFKNYLVGSTISAGGDISAIKVTGDALDNLLLAGADLGSDGQLNGVDDEFAGGSLDYLYVSGSYLGSITAAGVNPGADLIYFTQGDQSTGGGNISKVKFGRHSLDQTSADNPFGLLAGNSIAPFRLNGILYKAPFELDQFYLTIVA